MTPALSDNNLILIYAEDSTVSISPVRPPQTLCQDFLSAGFAVDPHERDLFGSEILSRVIDSTRRRGRRLLPPSMEAIGISLSAATGVEIGGGGGAGGGGGCAGDEAQVGTDARRRIGRDVVRVRIDQGGGRATLLEADVPAEAPHGEVCKRLREAYQREGLPEWHEASFHAALDALPSLSHRPGFCTANGRGAASAEREQSVLASRVADLGADAVVSAAAAWLEPRESGGDVDDDDERFYAAYADAMQRQGAREAVWEVEAGYRAAAAQLVASREAAEAGDERQRARECQALVLKSTFASDEESKAAFAALSAKHKERSLKAFRGWRRAMAELHSQQKAQFRRYVMDMVPSGGLGGGEVGVGDRGGCDPTPVLREVAGRGGGEGQGEVGAVHFVAYVGTSQLKWRLSACVREGSPLDYLSRPKITKVSGNNNDSGTGNVSGGGSTPGVAWGHLDGAMRRCLFGEGAIGVVMPCRRPAKGKKLQLAGGLVGACFESAELIFQDLPVQLDKAMQICGGGSGLRGGDWFVTRHSNLASCHVIFHVVVDDAPSSTPSESTISAVKEVVRAASSLGVAGLAVPIYMGGDSGSDSASRVLRAIRSELQGTHGTLNILHLLVGEGGSPQACLALKSVFGAAPPVPGKAS